jgi:hypothetical protein
VEDNLLRVGSVGKGGAVCTGIEWLDADGNVTHRTTTPGESTPVPVKD